MKTEVLIFQHIPKTGGITLSLLLLEHFARRRVFHVRHPQHPGAPIFGGVWGTLEEFASLSEEERSRFSCIVGHMPFGIHQHIPRQAKYLTVLRDPVERILSQHGQYNRMIKNGEIEGRQLLSLQEYLDLKPSALNNHQTRFLLAERYDGKTHEERFELAKRTIRDHFLLVGILERFEETVLLLNRQMDWTLVPYRRENVGSLKTPISEVPSRFVDLIVERNRLDFRIYAYAKEQLTIALESYGPTLAQDLTMLRTANEKLENPSFFNRTLELGVRLLRQVLGKQKSVRASESGSGR
jgi:hypothetical protein